MKTKTSSNRSDRVQRSAFTLVELMVVITIMAALMALTASAVLKFIGVQQTSNTQSTLDRVQSQLARAWSKVKDEAYKETIPVPVSSWIQTYLSGSDANTTERVRVIYVKLKLRQAFPMSFNEALYPPTLPAPAGACPLPPLPAYQTYLNSLGISGSSPQTAPIESSACLLMALQRGVSGAGIDPSVLTAGGAAGNFQLSPTSSIPYLTDAWGRPIFFTRAPAGNLYLNPIAPTSVANPYPTPWWPGGPVTCYSQPGANDPGDPQGYLNTAGWGATYGSAFFTVTLQVVAQGNTSYKLAPMVASGGPSDWTKPGQILPFDPITFSTTPGSDALFSTP
jgi:prepilin-type N-terminal cleavage/methylation domain-containing protein